GHSAFLALELARERVVGLGESFETARGRVASRNLFTTHTPVPAGHDRFPKDLIERHLGECRRQLRLSQDQFPALAKDPDDSIDRLCMTVLAMNMSNRVNGVSELHGQVSRDMWKTLFHESHRAPIEHVTNGVHGGSWIGDELHALLDKYLGPSWL